MWNASLERRAILCFRDAGPYPFEPCPEGKRIMWASMDGEGDRG
jgi:hypothetical protein